MERVNNIKESRKGKHLIKEERIVVSAVGGGADEQINGIQLRAIPEPATLGLLGIWGLAIAWYRRKFVR